MPNVVKKNPLLTTIGTVEHNSRGEIPVMGTEPDNEQAETGESSNQYKASSGSVSIQYRRKTGERQERDRRKTGERQERDRTDIGERHGHVRELRTTNDEVKTCKIMDICLI